jgi:hypothetical protein
MERIQACLDSNGGTFNIYYKHKGCNYEGQYCFCHSETTGRSALKLAGGKKIALEATEQ